MRCLGGHHDVNGGVNVRHHIHRRFMDEDIASRLILQCNSERTMLMARRRALQASDGYGHRDVFPDLVIGFCTDQVGFHLGPNRLPCGVERPENGLSMLIPVPVSGHQLKVPDAIITGRDGPVVADHR